MRPIVVLVSLGVMLVGSRADGSGPVTPDAGTIVVGSPVEPSKVERLPPFYRRTDLMGGDKERVVETVADSLEGKFRVAGWAAHDSNNAVVSYVVDTREGRVQLNLAAKNLMTAEKLNPSNPVIQQIAQSASRRGLVQVITEPTEVSVLLENDARGVTQVEFWCASGRHKLSLRKSGYKSQTVTITVQPQMVTSVKARMAPD